MKSLLGARRPLLSCIHQLHSDLERDGTRAVTMEYLTAQIPCFTIWKNTTADSDGYVTGLEPGTTCLKGKCSTN